MLHRKYLAKEVSTMSINTILFILSLPAMAWKKYLHTMTACHLIVLLFILSLPAIAYTSFLLLCYQFPGFLQHERIYYILWVFGVPLLGWGAVLCHAAHKLLYDFLFPVRNMPRAANMARRVTLQRVFDRLADACKSVWKAEHDSCNLMINPAYVLIEPSAAIRVIWRQREERKKQSFMVAFAMVRHERLGEVSAGHDINADTIQTIMRLY